MFVSQTEAIQRFLLPLLLIVCALGGVSTAQAQSSYEPYLFTTFAGDAGYGSANGTGSAARFYYPYGVAVDSVGNVYVADTGNKTIRKITPAGVVSTLAGLAGSFGSADGTGSAARFNSPQGVAVDSAGNVYVGDYGNCTIRKITPAGAVSTLAGLAGNNCGSADGTGSAARFSLPWGVAVDSAGYVYVADFGNVTIRKITPAGDVSTLAGLAGNGGSADGVGSAARFFYPQGVAVDSAGYVYVADTDNHTIRKITPAGVVSTLAGLAGSPGNADGTGSAARFNAPFGVAVDTAGNVYVADYGNNTIRKITPSGVVSTLAGLAGSTGSVDGTGSAARFDFPAGVAVDSGGYVYVADRNNHTIRKITPGGVVSTLAGLAAGAGTADGMGSAARFNYPGGAAVDSAANAYVADTYNNTIRKITPAGVVSTLAGLAGSFGSADGTGSAARFTRPGGVAVDSAGTVYVADTENDTIRKITPAGVVSTLAGLAGSFGSADGTGSAARFNSPQGVAVDSAGNVYVGDYGNCTIRKITPAGVVSTLAGVAGSYYSADGGGGAARFYFPQGVAVNSAGNLYVADTYNHTIRAGAPPVQLTSAVSRKTHGSAGTFDIDLPQTGAPGIECRTGGASNDYSIIFTFVNNVSAGAANVTSGTGSVSDFSVAGNQVTVNLTGVINAQTIVITLTNVNDGTKIGYNSATMGVLLGDTTGDGFVLSGDYTTVRKNSGNNVDQNTFRYDINADGFILSGDYTTVRQLSGTQLPSPP